MCIAEYCLNFILALTQENHYHIDKYSNNIVDLEQIKSDTPSQSIFQTDYSLFTFSTRLPILFKTLRAAKADESARGIRANSAQADLLPILLWRVLQNHCRRSCDAYIRMNGINVKLCYSSIYHIFIRQLFKI